MAAVRRLFPAALVCGAAALALSACGEPSEDVVLSDAPAEGSDASQAPAAADGAAATLGGGRQGLRIVGSSTVFPFSTTVAENFGAKTEYPTPVVESTGTGGGMNLFCAGVGLSFPDMTGASRGMKASEYQLCQDNGVTAITEIPIGFDGIIVGNASQSEAMDIAKEDLFLALVARTPMPIDAAGEPLVREDGRLREGASFSQVAGFSCETFVSNPFQRWSDVDSALPSSRIEVFGPPPTSGTRDAFVELGMFLGGQRIECLGEIAEADESRFEQIAGRIREDGAWVDSGENDNAIVQTLANAPSAFGIFGYSFLEQNGDRIQAASIDGVEPTYENIAEGVYPISRSMYVYVKNQHDGVVPGLRAFVEELTSEEAWGPFGYLAERGLIALPDARREAEREAARSLTPMEMPQ
ncbi:MAG: substrate-binding domain-containing protein [Alphaproteobacteria bacterium]|nr:substrate-binding domain-containing protein [Alphaproteobacteria bacterium]